MEIIARYPVPSEPNFDLMGVRKDLVVKIITMLKEEKVSYAEAYKTLDAAYLLMEHHSKFLHL